MNLGAVVGIRARHVAADVAGVARAIDDLVPPRVESSATTAVPLPAESRGSREPWGAVLDDVKSRSSMAYPGFMTAAEVEVRVRGHNSRSGGRLCPKQMTRHRADPIAGIATRLPLR
jgi:hypothetical protein